jgi:branched-chain amino acid transport system substrate-binding protein
MFVASSWFKSGGQVAEGAVLASRGFARRSDGASSPGLARQLVSVLAAAAIASLATGAEAFDQPSDGVYADRVDWGVQMDMSGPTAAVDSVWVKGLQLYIRKVNDSGGINGRKINLLIEDTRYDASLERVAYEKLNTQTPTLGLSGFGNSSAQAAMAALVRRGKLPILGSYTSTKPMLEPASPMFYNSSCTYGPMAQEGVGYFTDKLKLKAPKVAVIHLDVSSGVEFDGYVEAAAKSLGGSSISVPIKATAADATPQVLKIIAEKPDFIALHGSSNTAILVMRALNQYGVKAPVFSLSYLGAPGVYEALGPAAGANYYSAGCFTPVSGDEASGGKDFRDALQKYGALALADDTNFVGGWIAGQVVAERIAALGAEPTRAKLVASMDKGFTVDTHGLAGPMTYTSTDHRGVTQLRINGYDYQAKRFKAYGAYADSLKYVK